MSLCARFARKTRGSEQDFVQNLSAEKQVLPFHTEHGQADATLMLAFHPRSTMTAKWRWWR